jgi:hypothetical protein
VQRLHAHNLVTGAEKLSGPVVIQATNFGSLHHLQRPALRLANGTVYVAFGSHGDRGSYEGWVFGYDATTLARKFAAPLTGTSGQGGVWQSGAGPVVDASGNVWVVTGNGQFNAGTGNYGDSVVKLGAAGNILDYFAPHEQATMLNNDIDLGSSGVVILPTAVASALHQNIALATGKIGKLYLLDQGNLGQYNPVDNVLQTVVVRLNLSGLDDGIFGQPAYWNGNIYVVEVSDFLRQYTIQNGVLSNTSVSNSGTTYYLRGATPAVSANGTSNGIVWVLDQTGWETNLPPVLRAYDATNLANQLYSSPANGSGAAGPGVKFTVPTVANGKVYVGTQNGISIFGLRPN